MDVLRLDAIAMSILALWCSLRLTILSSVTLGLSEVRLGLIAHEATHLNRIERYLYDFAGGSYRHWRWKHNQHHKYTNNTSKDPDVAPNPFIRFFSTCDMETIWSIKHQWWCQWFVFPLVAISLRIGGWIYIYKHESMMHVLAHHSRCLLFLYLNIVRPLSLFGWTGLMYYAITSSVVGVTYGAIFSVSHVNDIVEHDVLNDDRISFQLRTTIDWRPGCRFTNWLTVGLNNQAVHHVYPNVSSYSYIELQKKLSTHKEYRSLPTFYEAIRSNARHLYNVSVQQSKTEKTAKN